MEEDIAFPAGPQRERPPLPRRELLEYLEVPLRRPFYVVIPFVLVTAGAVVLSYLAPELYRSSTVILVEAEKVPKSFVPTVATDSATQRLQTLRQEVMSRTRLLRVLHEIDPYPGALGSWAESDLLEYVRSQIQINVKGTDAFTIEFIHGNPQKAMQVANRLASLFIEEVTQEREKQVSEAHEFIDSQLQEARVALQSNEDAVRRYKQSHMGSLPEQLGANLATLQRLQLEHQAVSESLRAARERQSTVEVGLAGQLRSPAGASPSEPTMDLRQLESQLAALRTRYTDQHPDVRTLLARIAALEKALLANEASGGSKNADPGAAVIRSQVAQANRDIANLEAKQKDLEQRIAVFQARVEQTPRIEQELATMTRDFRKLDENYLALLSKKMDAQMAEKLEKRWRWEQFRVLDPANLPEKPFAPDRLRYLLIGLVLGLLSGLGAAVGAEILDHSLKNVNEAEAALPFPVLAVIPHVALAATRTGDGGPPRGSRRSKRASTAVLPASTRSQRA